MRLTRIVLRVIGGTLGLVAGLLAILGPLFFISNELQEMESAKQYNGHISIPGAIGGSLLVLGFGALAAFVSYFLIRYALRGNKPD